MLLRSITIYLCNYIVHFKLLISERQLLLNCLCVKTENCEVVMSSSLVEHFLYFQYLSCLIKLFFGSTLLPPEHLFTTGIRIVFQCQDRAIDNLFIVHYCITANYIINENSIHLLGDNT